MGAQPTHAHQGDSPPPTEDAPQASTRTLEQRQLDKLGEKLAERFAKIMSCSGAYKGKSEQDRRWADVAEMKAALKEWKSALIEHKLKPKSYRDTRFNSFLRDQLEKRGLHLNRNFSRWIDGDPDIDTLLADSGAAIGKLELSKDDGKTLSSTLSSQGTLVDQWNKKWQGYVEKSAVFGGASRTCSRSTRLSEPSVRLSEVEIASVKSEFDAAEKESAQRARGRKPLVAAGAASSVSVPQVASMKIPPAPPKEKAIPRPRAVPPADAAWPEAGKIADMTIPQKKAYLKSLVERYFSNESREDAFDTIRRDYARFEDNPWLTTDRLKQDIRTYQELIDETSAKLADNEIAFGDAPEADREARQLYWRTRGGEERWKTHAAYEQRRPLLELVHLEFTPAERIMAGAIHAPKGASDEEKLVYGDRYFIKFYKTDSPSMIQNRLERLRQKAMATADTSGADTAAE